METIDLNTFLIRIAATNRRDLDSNRVQERVSSRIGFAQEVVRNKKTQGMSVQERFALEILDQSQHISDKNRCHESSSTQEQS